MARIEASCYWLYTTRKELSVYDLPIYVWTLVLTGALGIPAATCAVLYRGALAAGLLARAPRRAAAVRFNVLGLLDLVVAVSLGVLLGLPGLVAVTPSTEVLRLLPLALVPTVPVPLAIALHIVALHRLRTATRSEED